jgi:hypothetical protein
VALALAVALAVARARLACPATASPCLAPA